MRLLGEGATPANDHQLLLDLIHGGLPARLVQAFAPGRDLRLDHGLVGHDPNLERLGGLILDARSPAGLELRPHQVEQFARPVTLNTGTGELPVRAAICSTSDSIALSRTASARKGSKIRATELAMLVSISRQAASNPLTIATACWSDHLERSSPSRIALRTRSSATLESPSAMPAAWPRR